jgi:hypothetical protein
MSFVFLLQDSSAIVALLQSNQQELRSVTFFIPQPPNYPHISLLSY